ncbi:MAG: PAS domain S-box protein [Acidobacteria bacterium]|nr:PAS domain S-box protein [Acidobacteriota bacterium]
MLSALSRSSSLKEVAETGLVSLLEVTSADAAALYLSEANGRLGVHTAKSAPPSWLAWGNAESPFTVGNKLAGPEAKDADTDGLARAVFLPLELDHGVFGQCVLFFRQRSENQQATSLAMAVCAHLALAIQHQRVALDRRRSDQRLQAILENSAAVIFIKDQDGRYVLANRTFESLFGVSSERVVGLTDFDLFPPDLANSLRQNDLNVLREGRSISVEETVPDDQGGRTYLSIKFPLFDNDGSVTAVCGIATDITERKQLEIAQGRLAAIVADSTDAVISKDLNGIVTSWNAAAERLFGYSAEEMIGQPIAVLSPPDRPDEMPSILRKIQSGQRLSAFRTQRRRKDGTLAEISLSVSPLRDSSGRIIGASKIARDISREKAVEREREDLLHREQQARKTAELLNSVSPVLGKELDEEKLAQAATDIATQLAGAEFGAFFRSVTGKDGESLLLYTLSGIDKQAFEDFPMPRATNLFGPIFRAEPPIRCDDIAQDPRYGQNPPHFGLPPGHLPVRSYLAVPVVTRQGQSLGGLLFAHSEPGKFTEAHETIICGIAAQTANAMDNARLFEQTRQAQEDLKCSNEELLRANRDLELFAYSASHDLREPMRTIALSAQLIEREAASAPLPAKSAGFLTNILTATTRMNALVDDLTSYMKASKPEEGTPPSVAAKTVLQGVIEVLGAAIRESGATITHGPLPSNAAIHESRLAQVFQNLIGNGVKYRGAAAPVIHITCEEESPGWYTFSVTDNGVGIEPQYAERIFELFKRLHSRERYPGSGIGLPISRRVIEQYGGRLWLQHSAPGTGSTFSFTVPKHPGD